MRIARFGLTLAMALAALVTACGDESITGPVGGEIVALQEIGGQPLPVAIEEEPGFVRTWLADTIHLGDNGRWSRVQRHDFATPSGTNAVVWETRGAIIEAGGELVLDLWCDDPCVAPDRLIPDVGGYRLEREVAVDSVITFRFYDIGLAGG